MSANAKFAIGQIIHHRRFGYRGVVFDVDAVFSGSESWYEQVARSRPPKEEPWYSVLPHGSGHTTYVAERNLERDLDAGPVHHPLIPDLFTGLEDGFYQVRRQSH